MAGASGILGFSPLRLIGSPPHCTTRACPVDLPLSPHLQTAGLREPAHCLFPGSVAEINDQDLTDLGGGRGVVSFSAPLGRVSHTDLSASLKQTREGRVIQFTVS